jgi:hypothetical protein
MEVSLYLTSMSDEIAKIVAISSWLALELDIKNIGPPNGGPMF